MADVNSKGQWGKKCQCLFCLEILPLEYMTVNKLDDVLPSGQILSIPLNDPVKNSQAFDLLCTLLNVNWEESEVRQYFDPIRGLPLCVKCHNLYQDLNQVHQQIRQLKAILNSQVKVIRETIERTDAGNNHGNRKMKQHRQQRCHLEVFGLDVFRRKVLDAEFRAVETTSLYDHMDDLEENQDDASDNIQGDQVKCETDWTMEEEGNINRRSQRKVKEIQPPKLLEDEYDFFDEGSDASGCSDMEYDEINSDSDYTPGRMCSQSPSLVTQDNAKKRSKTRKRIELDAESSDADYVPDDVEACTSDDDFKTFDHEKKLSSPRKDVSLTVESVFPVVGLCSTPIQPVKVEVDNENTTPTGKTLNKPNTKTLYAVTREHGTWKFTCTIDQCGKTFFGAKRNLLLHQSTAHKLDEKESDVSLQQNQGNRNVDLLADGDSTLPDLVEKDVLSISRDCPSTGNPQVPKTSMLRSRSTKSTRKRFRDHEPAKKPNTTATYVLNRPRIRGTSSRIKKFTCTIDGCGKIITGTGTQSKLRLHQRTAHQGDKDIKCSACCMQFTFPRNMRSHNNTVHTPNVKLMGQICDICNEKVPLEANLDHVRAHVGEDYMIKCPNYGDRCSKVFCTRAGLKVHLGNQKSCREVLPPDEDVDRTERTCETCGWQADNMTLLRDHVQQSHENGGGGDFPCPVPGCEQRFFQRQSVFLHIPLHRKHPTQSCDVCEEKLNVDEMEQHLKQVHRVQKVVSCFQCPFVFAKRENLVEHLLRHGRHNVFFCDVCGEDGPSFNEHRYLRRHYVLVHQVGTLEKKMVAAVREQAGLCRLCDTPFLNFDALKKHVKNVHPDDSNYYLRRARTCDLCKVKIPLLNLHQHVLDHVGEEYLIKCPNTGNCPLTFCTPLGVKNHLQEKPACRDSIPPTDLPKYTRTMEDTICDVCNHSTADSSNARKCALRNHLLRNHENGTGHLSCPIEGCQKRFCVRQSVVLHIYLHAKDTNTAAQVQVCDTCEEKVDITEMENHLKNIHRIPEVVKCVQCPFVFHSRENLVDHLYVHRNNVLFCDICGDKDQIFAQHSRLREHYFTEHQIDTRLSCNKCKKNFWSRNGLDLHINKFHTNLHPIQVAPEKKKFACTECHAVYALKMGLRAHQIKTHGAELLSCKYCDQKFDSFNVRSRHEQEHRKTVGREQESPCPEPGCGKIYSSEKLLQRHLYAVHSGMKHVCEHCGKAYSQKGSLNKHIRFVHLGLRPHMCDVCGEGFPTSKILKRHKLIHTGERPFACEICGQRFRQLEALKPHVEAHKKKGAQFKPTGAMKNIRKRVERKT